MSSKKNDKKKKNKKDNKKDDNNNWGLFFMSILYAFIIALLVGFLGANYVYLTRINLDVYFPTDEKQRPYTDQAPNGRKIPPLCDNNSLMNGGGKKMKGGSNGGGCGVPIDVCDSKLMQNRYFKGIFDYGFPYTLHDNSEPNEGFTFGGIITGWFKNCFKYSNIWLRSIIVSIISFTSSLCLLSPEQAKDIVPFIFGPFVMILLICIASLWYIPSLISVFWNSKGFFNFGFSLVGLFLGWTWLIPLITSLIQVFELIFKLLLLPMMLHFKELINIMGNEWNAYVIKLIFYILGILSAFTNLNYIEAIVISIIFGFQMIPNNVKNYVKESIK